MDHIYPIIRDDLNFHPNFTQAEKLIPLTFNNSNLKRMLLTFGPATLIHCNGKHMVGRLNVENITETNRICQEISLFMSG